MFGRVGGGQHVARLDDRVEAVSMVVALKRKQKTSEIRWVKVCMHRPDHLAQHRPVAVDAAAVDAVRAGHRHGRRHQKVVVLIDLRISTGFSENCQQNKIG